MKFSFPSFMFLIILLLATPAFAGTQTLITYYPAPTGDYNKIQTNYLKLGASTLNAIEEQYNCSYDPTNGHPACPAGIIYFDTDAHTLVVSDGTHWRIVTSACVPLHACSPSLNCNTDDCGNTCGICNGQTKCSTSATGIPGFCS